MSGPDRLTPKERTRWAQVGALAAVALVLGYLETFVPIPIPGVRLGLANAAVLVTLARGDAWGAVCVAVIKVAASGLLFGSPVALAYSAVGTALSLALMVPLSRLRTMRLWMVSVVGALAHEAGQLLVAQTLLGSALVWYASGPLLLAGCVTGALCGAVAARAHALLTSEDGASATHAATPSAPGMGSATKAIPGADGTTPAPNPSVAMVAILALLAFCVVTLRLSGLAGLSLALTLSLVACAAARVGVPSLLRALRPALPLLLVTVFAQALSAQAGTPVATLGPLVLTRDALALSLASCLRLLALVLASLALMRGLGTQGLRAGLARLLAPTRALGVRLEGPSLALDVALTILPQVMAADLRGDLAPAGQGVRLTWSFLVDALPRLIVSAHRNALALALAQPADGPLAR